MSLVLSVSVCLSVQEKSNQVSFDEWRKVELVHLSSIQLSQNVY